ncbi:TIGR01777 family oxidoreductase [Salinibacterium sp. ZJ454]|uniref:TIGR01777 family oxidoreductase n=1 Tax=Salinibacterium sp. ZJ454 TaxID=2708339 RepID=UPI001423FBF5|nr:TIGR01777 family oxidoreductase [Salinibacterium sp. ZJ454]
MTAGRVVIAGASGFIGRYLADRFRADGDTVITVGRSGGDVTWGDTAALEAAVDGADLLINLAGKSVNCRYTLKNKKRIMASRVLTTGELGRAIKAVATPPALWLNASTATIYRHADDRPMTEDTAEIGTGFSVNIATAWEREFFAHDRAGCRQVAMRLAIVLGDGSALAPMLALVRLGLGGPQVGGATPNGGQRFSWIHIDDVYRGIRFIQQHDQLSGPVNLSAPEAVTNRQLMTTLRRVLGMSFGLPAYRWMLEIGAWLMRTETELLLKSRWVQPARLTEAGFRFAHPALEDAVREIVAGRSGHPGKTGVAGKSG